MWAILKWLHLHRGFAMRVQVFKIFGGTVLSFYLVMASFVGIKVQDIDQDYQKQLAREYVQLHADMARQDVRMEEIERRQREIDAMQIEHRLTMTETTENSNHTLLIGVGLGLAMLILEAVIRGFVGIRKIAKGEDAD